MNNNRNVSTGIKWGIGLGIAYCVFLWVRWSFATKLISFAVVAVFSYLIILGLLFIEASARRKADGGFIDLKPLFQTLFISVLFFEAFYTLFNVAYLKWIDPGVIERMKVATNAMLDKNGIGFSDDQKNQTLQSFDDMKKSVEIGNAVKGYFTSVAVSGVLAFFIALIMRKRDPLANLTA